MAKQSQKSKINNDGNALTSIGSEYTTDSNSKQNQFSPSFEEIQMRAYKIYEQKGGADFDNWIEAEKILKEETRQKSK